MTTAAGRSTAPAQNVATTDEDEWADLDGFVKFEYPGDSYVGTYLQYIPNPNYVEGSQQPGARIKGQFQFINDDGLASINWTAGLSQIQNVQPGTELRVQFIEKQTTTAGFQTKAFKIQARRAVMTVLKESIIEAAKNGRLVAVASPQLEAGPDPLEQAGYVAPPLLDGREPDPFADDAPMRNGSTGGFAGAGAR